MIVKRCLSIFLYLIVISPTCAIAQMQKKLTPQPGKVYISETMENLELLNDSTLITSIWHSNPYSIYRIKNDTLFIKEAYNWYGPNNSHGYKVIFHPYKILEINRDTIIVENLFHGEQHLKPSNWENPLVFVSLEKFRQPVNNFRFLKLNYANVFDGSLEVSIDSTRKVSYKKYPSPFMHNSGKEIKWSRYLSPVEFESFKKILALSLVFSLPNTRGCSIDEARKDFTVSTNNKIYITKGCTLNYPQIQLFNYLYNLKKKIGTT